LSLDNITGYELVTATGEIVQANAKTNPDLYAGLRGAGYNYGVVTKFFVKLRPIGHIAKSPSDPNADKVGNVALACVAPVSDPSCNVPFGVV